MNDFNDSPLPVHFSPFRRVEGGPPTNSDFMKPWGYDGSWPPASMTFPGGFMTAEWTDYESRPIAERARIEALVQIRHTLSLTPRIELWTPPPLVSASTMPILTLQPDHDVGWPGSELRCGIGVIDATLSDQPYDWLSATNFWSAAVIAQPGQYLAGIRRAIERRLGGDARVLIVADTSRPAAWAERFHERNVLCEVWNEH